MTSASTKRRHRRNAELVAEWTHPIGTPVVVERDNGEALETVTTTEAFLSDGAHALIQVRGIPGNTKLSRVTRLPDVVRKPSHRRLKVTAPTISLVDGGQVIELRVGGRLLKCRTPDEYEFRGLAVALQSAKSVTLEIEEHPLFPVPEDTA